MRLEPLAPAGSVPVERDSVMAWVLSRQPAGNTLVRFKWSLDENGSRVGGRGSVRVAAPDSLRFDVRGPLGAGAAAAVVVGDSASWVDPEKALDRIVPSYPLLWALVGVPRAPAADATLRSLVLDDGRAWEFATARDTVEYVWRAGRFLAQVRDSAGVLGRAEVTYRPDGTLSKAKLLVPHGRSTLEVRFDSTARPKSFPPEIWLAR